MGTTKYDDILLARIKAIREGIEPQPLATLRAVEPSLRGDVDRFRRILCGKVYHGDIGHIMRLEEAKKKLVSIQQATNDSKATG